MQVLDYKEEIHFHVFNSWIMDHDMNGVPREMLPKKGLVIYQGLIPVCAGFIIQTDCPYCYFEFFCCNKRIKKEYRNEGINLLIEKLCEKSKELGYKYIAIRSSIPKLLQRGESYGFKRLNKNVTFMIKEL